jgi:hypothetical protein
MCVSSLRNIRKALFRLDLSITIWLRVINAPLFPQFRYVATWKCVLFSFLLAAAVTRHRPPALDAVAVTSTAPQSILGEFVDQRYLIT